MFAFVACRQWVYKVFIVYFSVCFRMNMFLIKWIFFCWGLGARSVMLLALSWPCFSSSPCPL